MIGHILWYFPLRISACNSLPLSVDAMMYYGAPDRASIRGSQLNM